jgi:cytochrome bd ubiquinol oxidase subunit II
VSEADIAAAVLLVGGTLYAVFGGADFGVGFWDLIAGGPERGAPARELIDRAIGPVWEANHVWLIFCLVVLWTAFPEAFSAVMSTEFVPLTLAALGVVLRGVGFAFRKVVVRLAGRRLYGALFAISSVLTPFFMGTVVGGVASGRVPAGGGGDRLSAWLNVTSVLVGLLFVAACAYLAAVFLVLDARRGGNEELADYFRRRAVAAGAVAGAVALAGIVVLHEDARYVFDGLVEEGLPLVVVSAACGGGALVLLLRGAARAARPLAVLAVAAVVWGWGLAQYPYLLPTSLTVSDAAAPEDTLVALMVVFGAAVLVVVPALALLFSLQQRGILDEDQR